MMFWVWFVGVLDSFRSEWIHWNIGNGVGLKIMEDSSGV